MEKYGIGIQSLIAKPLKLNEAALIQQISTEPPWFITSITFFM